MKYSVHLAPILWAVVLSPALLQTPFSCQNTSNRKLASLQLEAGGLDRVVEFNPYTFNYDVWLDGASEVTLRATSADPRATVRWTHAGESGTLGVGGGETTLSALSGTNLLVLVRAPGGAVQSYSLRIDPRCGLAACNDANRCTSDVCDWVSESCEFVEESPCPVEGHFAGGPFEGVSWEALGTAVPRRGVLDETSTFEYVPGHDVRFFVGETVFGEVAGKADMSWFDVADTAPIVGMSGVSSALGDRSHPLHTLINIAVFLYTFDEDGDSENGVLINEDTAWTFTYRPPVDFAGDWMRFRHEPTLRSALRSANDYDLLADHRPLRNSAYAIQTLYDALDVDARIFGPKIRNYSAGVGTEEYRETFVYNHRGNATFHRWDHPVPITYWAIYGGVDDNGNSTNEWDGPYPGIPTLTRFDHDADDNLTRAAIDFRANAIVEEYKYYEYDPLAQRLSELHQSKSGSLLQRTTWEYDDESNRVREEVYRPSDDSTTISQMEYDSLGNQTWLRLDDDADGAVDREWKYEYDTRGNRTRMLFFSPVGELYEDTQYEFTYSESGDLVQWSVFVNDIHWETRMWTYDDDGNPVTLTSTIGEDMSIGAGFTASYEPTGWAVALHAPPLTGPRSTLP